MTHRNSRAHSVVKCKHSVTAIQAQTGKKLKSNKYVLASTYCKYLLV